MVDDVLSRAAGNFGRWVAVRETFHSHDTYYYGPYDRNSNLTVEEQHRQSTGRAWPAAEVGGMVSALEAAPHWLAKWLTTESHCARDAMYFDASGDRVTFTAPVTPEDFTVAYLLGLAAQGWSCQGAKVATVKRTWDYMGLHTEIALEGVNG